MTSPNEFEASPGRPSSFDEWLQAFKEQASFFTGLKLDVGIPRWQLADVLPVLPIVGAGVGLASGLVFAVVRGVTDTGWLAAVLANPKFSRAAPPSLSQTLYTARDEKTAENTLLRLSLVSRCKDAQTSHRRRLKRRKSSEEIEAWARGVGREM